jgi:hypothetical protein
MKKLGIGLYGTNGHQIEKLLAAHPRAELVAVAAFDDRPIPAECGEVPHYPKSRSWEFKARVKPANFPG